MAIKTRETTGTGVTNKGAPLTNAEVDNNFIELVAEDATKLDLSGGTLTGSLTTGSSITLNGAQQGGYPSLRLQSGSSSYSFIQMGTSSDPDEGIIEYSPAANQMSFTAGTVNAFTIKSTGPQLGRDLDLNSYSLKSGTAGMYQRTLNTGLIDCGATGGFSMYLGYQGSYSFSIHNGEFNQNYKAVATFTMHGSCDLYHNGLLKFKTQAYGIEVRGDSTNGSGAIQLNCEQNSHGVKIKAPPHSAAATYTLTLPTSAGASGQVLSTDGSGGLSWVSNSGGGSSDLVNDSTPQLGGDLDTNGNHIYFDQNRYVKFDGDTYNFWMGYQSYENAITSANRNFVINMGNTGANRTFSIANGGYTSGHRYAAIFDPRGKQTLYYSTLSASYSKLTTEANGIEIQGDATNGSGAITLNCEQNSHGVTIKSPPHSAAATYTLTLPTSAGSNGQVLQTDGSGGLSWASSGGGGGGVGEGKAMVFANLFG